MIFANIVFTLLMHRDLYFYIPYCDTNTTKKKYKASVLFDSYADSIETVTKTFAHIHKSDKALNI